MIAGLRAFLSRLAASFRNRRLDRGFDVEVSTHIDLLIDEHRDKGLSEIEATRAAYRKLGRVPALRDQHRDQRGLPFVDALRQDSKFAARTLWKAPAFTAIVVLSLALGIGANTALFTLIDGLLLRSLPVRNPEQLVQLHVSPMMGSKLKKPLISFGPRVFEDFRSRTGVFSAVVGFWPIDRPMIEVDGSPEPERGVQFMSANFFQDLGVSPIAGRSPASSDDNVAVISARWHRTRFAGGSAVGRTLSVNGRPYSIIGVAPLRFHGFLLENAADIWLVSRAAPELVLVGRMQPTVTPLQAQAAVSDYMRRYFLDRFTGNFPPDQAVETEAVPVGRGVSQLREDYTGALWSLMALVSIVLLTTCTNVGNLLMLRNAARVREMTVRAALGAGRGRLTLQYLVESTLLAAAGCILGLLLARWGVALIVGMLPLATVPDNLTFYLDARVLTFAIGVSLIAVLLFGVAPARRATRVDLTGSLRSSHGTTSPKGARRLGRALVSCQVGLSVVLLVAGGLFVQTLLNLSHTNLGFNADRLLQVSIDTRGAGYREGQVGAPYRLLLERVRALAGVRSVTAVRNAVMRNARTMMAIQLPGLQRQGDEVWQAAEVGPGFFETMGYTLVRGRTFTATDYDAEQPAFVINEAFAKHFFPNDDPVARNIGIVGIIRDAKFHAVRAPLEPMMFEKMRKEPDRVSTLLVRISGDPKAIAPAIRQAVQGVHPRLLLGVRTMQEDINRDIARERMVAAVSAFFSGLGLLLASIGIFGVASYTVAQRTKELAIRRALGAGRWSVIRESLRETTTVFAVGLLAGTAAAIGLVRLMASAIADLLFGLTATSAANIAAAVTLMIAVALTACVLPAHRATRIDPLAGIREE
jgi:predicted permease